MAPPPEEFDPVLLSPARLGVVTALLGREEATFPDLKDLLGLTQGNLGAHLRTLEEAGYVGVQKMFKGKIPLTVLRLTRAGKSAFDAYRKKMNGLLALDR